MVTMLREVRSREVWFEGVRTGAISDGNREEHFLFDSLAFENIIITH
jgi:hypothetical protein